MAPHLSPKQLREADLDSQVVDKLRAAAEILRLRAAMDKDTPSPQPISSEKRIPDVSHDSRRASSIDKTRATTFRLYLDVRERLDILASILRTPKNRLVNAAVALYVDQRLAEVGANLEETLKRLAAYRKLDPEFELSIEQFADHEARFAKVDPFEGRLSDEAGPAQTLVRDLLRG